MNKNIRLLLLLTLVSAAIYFIVVNKPWSTFKAARKDFSISDTASITKIFIADKRNHKVVLQRNAEGEWMVNNTWPADVQKINLVKATLHDVEVRNPLTEAEYNSMVALMAANAVKVELYSGEELIKTIYVGGATADHTGTYMMIEGSSTPFVTHIPGFVGYLTPRFNVYPIKWKTRAVFTFTAEQIKHVSVSYPMKKNASFELDNSTPVVRVYSKELNLDIPYDTGFVRYYLSSFNNLYFEGYDEDIPPTVADSLRQSTPYCIMDVHLNSGKSKRVQVHFKPVDRRTKSRVDEETGKAYEFDPDKYFAFIDDEKEVAYIQHYNFGRLFKHAGDFVPRK